MGDRWVAVRVLAMPNSSRRSFVIRAGWTAAASLCRSGRAGALEGPGQTVMLREARSLIEPERKAILRAMEAADIPGAAVCLIHDGKPSWVEGLGVTDPQSGRRVAADTIFSIQSTSKHVTATAVMLAVQSGLLDLDRPIAAYVPDFTVRSRFEAVPEEKITLRLLMSHRAGFTHEAPVGNNYDPAFPSFEAHVRSVSDTWLRFPVGTRYRYSNLGFDLAGYILQARSGMVFAECLRTLVFEPLGMLDSTAATDVYAARDTRALGHEKGYTTVPLRTPLIPSGGVYTSARDMATYSLFHLQRGKLNGKVILKEELWDEMHSFSLGGDYSLGVIRTELRYGQTPVRLLSHRGGGFGFGCVFDYCPPAGLAWIALFNRPTSAGYRFGEGLVEAALVKRYGPRKPRLPASDLAPIELPAERLRQYVGNYIGRNISADISAQGHTLNMQVGTKQTSVYLASPTDAFTAAADGDTVSYEYHAPSSLEPAHLECSAGEDSLDYNDGAQDPPGSDSPAWTPFLGQYEIHQWGQPSGSVTIHRKNGYLYLNNIRLFVESEPGLFFTPDGEAVDFRHDVPTWRNIRLQRVAG
jgi:CubicO group peptidase (beta-lactamase class C family)